MLKKRIAASLIVRNGIVVQSIGFKKFLPVGKPEIAIEFLNQWGIDEIILLDISARRNLKVIDFDLVKSATKKCFVPLTVGGGIRNVDDIKALMQCGADKISLNYSAIHEPGLISEAAKIFGDQCVVVSIDSIETKEGYRVYDYLENKVTNILPAEMAQKIQDLGAGEVLINSVNRDGSYIGYDLKLINEICSSVTIPVICAGGAKNANDLVTVFQHTNVSAASAANFFHFTEHSVNMAKAYVNKHLPIRIETFADYTLNPIGPDFRLVKKNDKELEEMLFVRIEKEII